MWIAIEARYRIISVLSQAGIIVEGGKTVTVWIRQLGRKDKDFELMRNKVISKQINPKIAISTLVTWIGLIYKLSSV